MFRAPKERSGPCGIHSETPSATRSDGRSTWDNRGVALAPRGGAASGRTASIFAALAELARNELAAVVAVPRRAAHGVRSGVVDGARLGVYVTVGKNLRAQGGIVSQQAAELAR